MNKLHTRICKDCKKELKYSCYQSWYKSEKNNCLCRKCAFRKKRLNNPLFDEIKKLYDLNLTNREIAKRLKIDHGRIAYYLQSLGLISNWDKRYPPIDKVDEENARCVKCKLIKSLDKFQYGRKGQKYEYRFSFCNECRKKQSYLNLNKSVKIFLKHKYNVSKLRAKKANIIFSLKIEDFINQYELQKGKCFYTDEIMKWEVGVGKSKNSLSIDKIVPKDGYVEGNFVFCSNWVNTSKGDLSLTQIKKWMPLWYKKIVKKNKLYKCGVLLE